MEEFPRGFVLLELARVSLGQIGAALFIRIDAGLVFTARVEGCEAGGARDSEAAWLLAWLCDELQRGGRPDDAHRPARAP